MCKRKKYQKLKYISQIEKENNIVHSEKQLMRKKMDFQSKELFFSNQMDQQLIKKEKIKEQHLKKELEEEKIKVKFMKKDSQAKIKISINKKEKKSFIFKVYLIQSLKVSIIIMLCVYAKQNPEVIDYQMNHPNICYLCSFIVLLILFTKYKSPKNNKLFDLIQFNLFTACELYVISFIFNTYDSNLVNISGGLALVIDVIVIIPISLSMNSELQDLFSGGFILLFLILAIILTFTQNKIGLISIPGLIGAGVTANQSYNKEEIKAYVFGIIRNQDTITASMGISIHQIVIFYYIFQLLSSTTKWYE